MNASLKVSRGNPLGALFGAFFRDVRDLLDNPFAFVGGVTGVVLAALAGFFGHNAMAMASTSDDAADDVDFEIDFTPGTIARLGIELDEKDLPQKIVVAETRAPDPTDTEPVKEAVTSDEKAQPTKDPDKLKPKDQTTEKSNFRDNKDRKLPTSSTPSSSNTPYHDLPTVNQLPGNPFGDPEGWDDLTRAGDPWSTEVMKALNNMAINTYGARAAVGDFNFQLSICKDGSIKQVLKKGGSMAADGQAAVLLALEQLRLPTPSKKILEAMPGNCARIKYTFRWTSGRVK